MYGLETVPLKKTEGKEFDIPEMKMLCWEVGVKEEKESGMKISEGHERSFKSLKRSKSQG